MVKNITKKCSGGRAGDASPRPMRIKRSALHAIFKRLKRDKKLAQKDIKSTKHNLKSLAQQIRESTSLLVERRRGLAKERRTLVEQNARLERIENQLINDYLREQIAPLAMRGPPTPTQTSEFM